MRVIFTQDIPNDAGGFFIGAGGADPHFIHAKQNPPVDGFETIASVW